MAVTDFLSFKKLMVKRNVELELEVRNPFAVELCYTAGVPRLSPPPGKLALPTFLPRAPLPAVVCLETS